MADFSKIRYFKPSEFKAPDKLDQRLIDKLDLLRAACGFPIKVNSDVRSAGKNEMVGGAKNSMHLQGKAVDLHVSDGKKLFIMVEQALKLALHGISPCDELGCMMRLVGIK